MQKNNYDISNKDQDTFYIVLRNDLNKTIDLNTSLDISSLTSRLFMKFFKSLFISITSDF